MAESTTVKGLDGVKVPKLEQAYINAIEKRLVLSGGTTFSEFGVDLANKFGKAANEIKKLQSIKVNFDVMTEQELDKLGYSRQKSRKEEMQKIRSKIDAQKEARRVEEVGFMTMAKNYVIKEYGEEKRNGNGDLRGYGDRIEMVGKGHLKKIW